MRLSTFVLAAVLAAASSATTAQVSVNIHVPGLIAVAPPAPRFERMPAPRVGHVWVAGHWQWERDAYGWRQGYWERARPDYDYAPGRWVRADGGWRWAEPNWKRKAKHRGHDDDRYESHGRHDDHGHGGGYHCPPGQAKKGRC
ncbi:YXWGXW repeat-containing protein [Variovorax paradoxus]|nr:YXWGXW repeat-containing protein [Variovorax paradoxus]